MAKTANPFADFDYTKMWGDFKLPMLDVEAFVAAQQKNLETLQQVNRLALEGWQAVAARQADFAREAFEKTSAAAQEIAALDKPADRLAKQAAFTKSSLDSGIKQARELGGMVTKTTNSAVDLVNKRFAESVDELSAIVGDGLARPHSQSQSHPQAGAKA